MRVLQVISKSEHGGAQTQVAILVDGLIEAGHTVSAVSSTPGPLLDHARSSGADTAVVAGLASSNPLQIARAVRAVRAIITSVRPDVVHCHSSHAGLVTRLAAASTRTPCVFTAHGLPFKRGAPRVRRAVAWIAELLLARLPASMIVVNEYERSLARRALLLRRSRIRVIATAVPDGGPMRPAGDDGHQSLTVGTVCRLAPPKRVDVLIRAAAMLEHPATLKVVGSGPDAEELLALAQRGEADVDFLGDRDDVADILDSIDLFVICSEHEGAPVSVLEAMRAGLPIIASDLPGLREQLGPAGVFVDNEPAAVARAIDALLASPEQRVAMGTSNQRRQRELFSSGAMVAATLDWYGKIAR